MTQIENTTNHIRGKHLTKENRVSIEDWTRFNSTGPDDLVHVLSNRQIARLLNTSPQTINNELKRGTVRQISRQKQGDKVYEYQYFVYSAQAGQTVYERKRQNSGRRPLYEQGSCQAFINFADEHLLARYAWSPDQVVMAAHHDAQLSQTTIPCTTTLYNWIDQKRLKTRNIDLAEKISRQPKKVHSKTNEKVLGRSIEKRPIEVDERREFGHWEIDSVVGQREGGDLNLLTLTERKTRYEEVILIQGKESCYVNQTIATLKHELGSKFEDIFKTITADNGSEFSELTKVVPDRENGGIYYAHPYASYERGSNERNNKIIRRIYPKGKPIVAQPAKTARETSDWMNNTPRRSLGTQTPRMALEAELQKIFQAS
ncbi:IS30 family transposase [Ligilactobacillus acidipiscis]|jgi:IS30 family transposase|uniref:IS30 family transposase n=1 Tax=Ligilactobacillus acidipiscis TaxID=89059 RepID=UPI00386386AC